MTETATMTPGPQRLRALERANEVRLARAELKRRIADGDVSAAEVILACPVAGEQLVGGRAADEPAALGEHEVPQVPGRNQISELKQIGELTERQRRLLADQLESL